MDYKRYRDAYFTEPPPAPRFDYVGLQNITLYFAEYDTAVAYYTQVLGPPGYVEGDGTRGWRIGTGWLTLLLGKQGHPQNVEVTFVMQTPATAERLQQAFIEAGGSGSEPSNQLMYEPIRACPVRDPFGTHILIISPLSQRTN